MSAIETPVRARVPWSQRALPGGRGWRVVERNVVAYLLVMGTLGVRIASRRLRMLLQP